MLVALIHCLARQLSRLPRHVKAVVTILASEGIPRGGSNGNDSWNKLGGCHGMWPPAQRTCPGKGHPDCMSVLEDETR